MAAIDEVREHLGKLKRDGSVRANVPPGAREECYNPIEGSPRQKIEELRDEHLRHIVEWAYKRSGFYRKMWDKAGIKPEDIKGYEDLGKLPVWRKSQQREDEAQNPPFGSRAIKELIPFVPRLYKSTGTSGSPTMYLWTGEDFEVIVEAMSRWFHAGGCRAGGGFVDFFPSAKGQIVPPWMEASVRNIGLLYYTEEVFGYTPDPDSSTLFHSKLGEFYKPLCTSMTPEFLGMLGRQFESKGEEPPYDVILPAGMPLTPRGRHELQALYKKASSFVNIMSSNDGMVMYGCRQAAERGLEDLHESEDLFAIEVVEPGTGKRAAEGKRGELVVTTFFNHACPLIRFGLEDVFENSFTTEPCSCGRTTRRWLKLCPGRLKDIFSMKGKELMPWDVEMTIGEIPDTTMVYQLVLDSWDMEKLKIEVETLRKLPDQEYKQAVKDTLESKLEVPVEVEMVPAGTVSTQAGGYKTTKVVDKRPKRD